MPFGLKQFCEGIGGSLAVERSIRALCRGLLVTFLVLAAIIAPVLSGQAAGAADQPGPFSKMFRARSDTGEAGRTPSGPVGNSDRPDPFAEFDRNAQEAREALSYRTLKYSYERVEQLNTLRNKLAADRDRAGDMAERGTLESRILEAQLEAVGPPPEEGKLEPPAVTMQREGLNARLGAVMSPILRLQDAEARAAVLVDEVDERLSRLNHIHQFEPGRSPLDPRLWMNAGEDVARGFRKMSERLRLAQSGQMPGRGLGAIATAIGVLVLIPWASRLLWRKLYRRLSRRLAEGTSIVRRMLLAMLGDAISAFVIAASLALGALALGFLILPILPDEQAGALAVGVAVAGFIVAAGQWVGQNILHSPFPQLRMLALPPERMPVAMRTFRWIAYLLGGEAITSVLEGRAILGEAFGRFVSSVFVIVGGLLLWKLANLLREAHEFQKAQRKAERERDPEAQFRASLDFISPISRLLKLFALATVGAALVGYVVLSRDIFSSSLLSLTIIVVAVYLNRSVALLIDGLVEGALYAFRRLLRFVPLLLGMLLTLLVIPLLAVIWGYSGYEIADAVKALRSGVEFGEVKVTAGDFITFIAVFFLGYFVTRWLQRFLKVAVLPDFGVERGLQAAIVTGLGYVGILTAAIVAIATTGLDLSSLAFVAGALSVGLGFGLQSVVENFTSGILLLIERPVKVGDVIEVGEYSGVVRKIAVRSTHIETADNHQIIVPNSMLITEAVRNRSFLGAATRVTIPVSVAYGSDADKVRATLLDIADKAPLTLRHPKPFVMLSALAEGVLSFNLFVYVRDVGSGTSAASEINYEIVRRFAEEGIEIAFPRQDLRVRGLGKIFKPGTSPAT